MKINPSKKMSIFAPTIFKDLKMASAKKHSTGAEIIDLSLGSPDIPPDKGVRQRLSDESINPSMYGYTLAGIHRFNEAVANYYHRRTGVSLNPETEILQTMGSQEGLVHLPFAFCDEGDIVLTTNPAYIAYDAGIKLAGAVPYYLPLRAENNFLPDLEAIPKEIAEKAKMLILNLPGNPVPAIPTKEYFEQVVKFAHTYQIIVLHDAAYSEFYFTGDAPMSFLATQGAKDVGIEINSLSKSFSLAGARIAYIAGNPDMIDIMRTFKSNLDYGIFAPIQEAAITALDNAEEITDSLRATFSIRHQVLTKGLQSLGWEVTPSNGGMFVWAKYPYNMDDRDFVFKAIEDTGVVMVPGTVFGSEGKGFVRIALVQDVRVIEKAVELLKNMKQ